MHGRRIEGFRPGMALRDFRIDFAIQEQGQPMTVVGHTEQLRLSRCYQSSDSMRCVTCHDPHRAVPAEKRVEHYRKKCLTCHTEAACGLEKPKRLSKSATDNCVECHMPSSSTDIPHVAAHHHRIGIHTPTTTATRQPEAVQLVPLSDTSHLSEFERDRCLGLAYLSLSQQNSDPQISGRFRQSAQKILQFVIDTDPRDAETIVGLAQSYLRQNPQRALELANQALANPELPPDARIKALFALSDSYLVLGNFQAAIPPLQELVKLRRQASDWLLLAFCQLQLQKIPEALEAAKVAAEIRPDRPNHHALLAELYGRQNETELAAKHKKLAQLLGPK